MEKYKYIFCNQHRQIEEVEAETLTEAKQKIGLGHYYVEHEFPFMAIIRPPINRASNLVISVRWDKTV